MKPKIFIIGFNKTATRSLHDFFIKNSLLSVHWDNDYLAKCFEVNKILGKKLLSDGFVRDDYMKGTMYDDCTVFSDMTNQKTIQEAMHYYKILDQDYPNSKFILNMRDTESWIESRMNHHDGMYHIKHLDYFGLSNTESGRLKLKKIYKKMHKDHHCEVLNYFKERKNDLIVFDIYNDDIEKIVKFFEGIYELDASKYGHHGKTEI